MAEQPVNGVEPTAAGGEAREPRDVRDPLLGRVVGVYRIQEQVGEGTGLPSYLAEHVHLDRQVLFKLFHPPRGGESEAVRQAMDRARELSALKHEGVLPLVEIGACGDGFMYVVLELSGARPLPALLAERGALAWPAARALGRQIVAALQAAEAASLIGTEVTEAQVFVATSASGELRARVDLVTPEGLGWARAGTPDQVQGVGRLLYTMLAGRAPASAPDQPPPDLVLSFPERDVPPDADALVMRALDPDPARRWPDLSALHRELGGRDRPARGRPASGEAAARGDEGGTRREGDVDEPNASLPSEEEVSFGRRFFTRPSRRALIAGGVGAVVAIVLALVIVSGPSDSDSDAYRSAEDSKLKLTSTVPPPSPIVLPPPPVPDPEPEQADGVGGAAPLAAPSESDQAAGGPSLPSGDEAPAEERASGAAASGAPAPRAAGAAGPAAAGGPTQRGQAETDAVPAPANAPGRASAASGAVVAPLAQPAPAHLPAPAARPAPQPALAIAAPSGKAPLALSPAAAAAASAAPQSGPAAPAGALVPAASTAPPKSPAPAPSPASGTSAETAPPARAGDAGPCAVSLGSIPWSDVQVDGQRAGFTPLTDFPVACGMHEIRFSSPERGLERRITINVRPGDKVKRIVDLGGAKGQGASPSASALTPPCRVTLGSRPWSEIWIDGQRAGTTPLVDYPVTCGTHDVLFLSRESNVQHRESLTVQSTLKKVITLVESTD